MSGRAGIQTGQLRLDAIIDDVVCLGPGQYRAILEAEGIHFGLLGAVEQEALLSGFASWLNSLAYPIQVLARVTPLDLGQYLGALERRAAHDLAPALADLALDHMRFLQGLARERTLLERHLYVIVPAGDGAAGPRWPFGKHVEPIAPAFARRQLTARCDEVARGLGRCRVGVRRLTSFDLAELLHACWCPERARKQRLRAELADFAALAVRGSLRIERTA